MPGVTVRFLGSGDAFGSGGRFQACIHVRGGGCSLLLDCGASSLVAMKRLGVDPGEIELVLVSHLHGDHFAGVPFLVLDGQFGRRTRPLTVAGPRGVAGRVQEAMEVLFPGSSGTAPRFPVEFVELEAGQRRVLDGVAVTPHEVVHLSGAPALALRLECQGRVVAYSGDTEWTEALVEVARGADLFICEAYRFDSAVKYHLDYRTLMTHRTRLGCRRLVLTHMSPDMLRRIPAPAAGPLADTAEIEWADDGKVVVV